MADFKVGDVVVCVDIAPREGSGPANIAALENLRAGRTYRISLLGYDYTVGPYVKLHGVEDNPLKNKIVRGFRCDRFRHLPKADEQFTEQMRRITERARERTS